MRTIDGKPLDDIETVSYYAILAAAGHDTSSASISGGMHALIEHPTSWPGCGRTRS
jgi:cytochrome P450